MRKGEEMALVSKTLEEIKRRARIPRPKRKPKSDEEIKKAAESDPDTYVPTEKALEKFKPWREREREKAEKANVLSEDDRKFEDNE